MSTTDLGAMTLEEKRRAVLALRKRRQAAAGPDTIEVVPRRDRHILSHQQESLWLLNQLDPGSPVYNVPIALRLHGPVDVPALEEAFRALAERHESLRTVFGSDAGGPYQRVLPAPARWPLPVTDLADRPAPEREERLHALVDAEGQRPIDLAAGPMLRTGLVRLGPDEHVLVLLMHHIVTDGWSAGVFADDLAALYAGETRPELRIQPVDYAAWQRGRVTGAHLNEQLDYWRTHLDGAPVLDFPSDRVRPANPTGAGAVLRHRLDPDVSTAVRALARSSRTSLLPVLQAGFVTVLSRWSGQPDVVTGTVLSGRTRADIEPLVGYFANTVVLRVDAAGDPTFGDLVRRCSESVLGALGHQDVPFGMVVDALKPERVPGRNPLFQVGLTLQAAATSNAGFRLPGTRVEPVEVTGTRARFDVGVTVIEQPDQTFEVQVEYSTELFDEDRMLRLVRHFERALRLGIADPEGRVATLPLLAPEEWAEIQGWNPEPVARDALLLHDLVAEWVARTPDAPAVINNDDLLSYADLSVAADRVAVALRDLGVDRGKVVGVLLDRGPELPVAELGVLKAGGAWLPLDPQQPPARWAAQLADAGAIAVVTTSALAGDLPPRVKQWHLDTAPQTDVEPVHTRVSPDDLAYIIYTSGSTGKPKGVMISHRAAAGFVQNARELFGLKPGDRLLQFANPAFDVSVFDIFAALGSGAAVVTAPRETLLDPDRLQQLMQGVTVADLPPAVLRLLDPEPLTELRALFVGLEAFPAELVNRWVSPSREFHNGYGPTEATVACVDYRCPTDGVRQSPPIGRAMTNHRVYVLDERLQPVPVGVAGELFIGGDGLARGYANRPGLTAERFLPDPFTDERMYRTGDVVRWRSDGNLEFLGRRDRQVKIRGLRIELAEVEHALAAVDGVRQAVVTVDQPGTPKAALVGYVVGPVAGVREALMRRLPLHMVPTHLIELDALPLTGNGKLDHAKLPAPSTAAQEHRPPATDTERAIAGIWHDLLGTPLDQIGGTDSFFELGGNSLQVVRLRNAVREKLRTDLDAATLFTHPVLRDLAARIDAAGPAEAGAEALTIVDRDRPQPLSPQQEGLLFLHEADPESALYHLPIVLRLDGRLDLPALRRALTALVGRHEALRTRIVTVDGVPRQIIEPAPADLPLDAQPVPSERVHDWATEQVMRPFDMASGPQLRLGLARVTETDHVLVLAMHHIITDGWSVGVLARDLAALYEGRSLPAPAVQPVDHAAWQQSEAGRAVLDAQLTYWRERLDGAPVLDFPADRPRPAEPTGAGALLEQTLDPDVAAGVRALARSTGTSLLAVLQAGFVSVLTRWTGQSDVVVGSIFSGRTRTETEDLVGLFANTVVLRADAAGEATFGELVGRCSESVLGALGHQDVPFGMVVDALKPERVPGRNPLFQVSLTLQAEGTSGADFRLPGLRAEPVDVTGTQARFDVGVTVIERETLTVQVEYSTELFDEDRMLRLVRHFERALRLGIADPEARVATLPLLAEAEWAEIQGWNPRPAARDALLLHDLVAEWVARTPDAPAVIDELSYADLSVAADRVAVALRDLGVDRGKVVGVLLDRGPELPVAELGVLKAGGAWLPLDPQQPPARWAAQLADAGAIAVVTTSALAGDLPPQLKQWHLDTAPQTEVGPVHTKVSPDDLAYIIYTSGSTGKPKGVMISHRAAASFVQNARELFGLKPGDRLLQFANPAFDVSVFDIFAALGSGAAVVTAPRETLLDPDKLQALLESSRVTVADLPPAVLRLLNPEPLTDLRALFVGLEAFPAELVNRWVSPTREFHNGYGPTEATVACVDYRCPTGGVRQSPPIGRAMTNHRVYVLDERLQPVPVGVAGELFIGGDGLARGYANRPGLTAERFLPDPFTGERMYRTGDVVRWRSDGNLEFLGRRDRQVKIRGLRIELAEVEHALAAVDGVRQAVVTVDQPGTPQAALVGYVVGPAAGVREQLMQRLPLHMVPAHVIELEALPLTGNGKLDHAKLPTPQARERTHVPPGTDTERALARIWHDLLGVPLDRIGLHDTFFDLGGNSLQVVRLRNAVREELHADLDVRRLYAAPSLAGLARLADDRPGPAGTSELVELRPGQGAPLFLIHAVGGSVAPYQALAGAVDTPVIGIEDPALHGEAPATELSAVAARYAEAIRRARPDGPYRLAGWSMGGILALEVAARLREAGGTVPVVVLIDSSVPVPAEPPSDVDLLIAFAGDVAGVSGTATPDLNRAELDSPDRVELVLERLEAGGSVPTGIRDELRRRVAVFAANARMLAAHELSPCPAPVVLLSAGDGQDEQVAAWTAYAGKALTHHAVPGTHHTVLHQPEVATVLSTV
ncbi:amino acid adenylation domain-containing protein [Paractinoplanes toevensis]|uniref:Pyoverdine synthetase D n=1 Tax=Paractinoplanes toevensis TaxID=571911 RepID=A0A919WBE1_9ACTN|nr:non-ribosomal peptide synthetase [Actinoplanes toevensis]GIM97030.1 pyoverdine synthetase D [Actinoplanes toevensis]